MTWQECQCMEAVNKDYLLMPYNPQLHVCYYYVIDIVRIDFLRCCRFGWDSIFKVKSRWQTIHGRVFSTGSMFLAVSRRTRPSLVGQGVLVSAYSTGTLLVNNSFVRELFCVSAWWGHIKKCIHINSVYNSVQMWEELTKVQFISTRQFVWVLAMEKHIFINVLKYILWWLCSCIHYIH